MIKDSDEEIVGLTINNTEVDKMVTNLRKKDNDESQDETHFF